MKLGFVGLGVMGRPSAHNLARGPEGLVVSAVSDRHFAEFEAKGVRASADPKSVAEADLVFLCLPDDKVVREVLFGPPALAEILPMAVKLGLDPDQVEAVVNSGTGRSYASEFFAPRILKGGFSEGYPLGLAYKDLVSAAKLGAAAQIPLPVTAAATATYQTALRQGHGDKDKGAMILVFEALLGVKFRSGGPA